MGLLSSAVGMLQGCRAAGEDSTEGGTEQYSEPTTEPPSSAELADSAANDTREALTHDGSQQSSVSVQTNGIDGQQRIEQVGSCIITRNVLFCQNRL